MLFLRFLIVAMLLVSLPACVFRRSPSVAAAAPPPQPAPPAAAKPEVPLSIPQTRVELPPSQPLDPAALQVELPPPPEPVETAPPAKPPRRPAPPVAGPATQPQPEQPAPPAPAAEERPRIQEIISAEERKRLMDEINNRKREVGEIAGDVSRRSLSAQDRDTLARMRGLVQQCDQAAERGDLRQANALCERAIILARGLKSAR
jgi:hypothetical protein